MTAADANDRRKCDIPATSPPHPPLRNLWKNYPQASLGHWLSDARPGKLQSTAGSGRLIRPRLFPMLHSKSPVAPHTAVRLLGAWAAFLTPPLIAARSLSAENPDLTVAASKRGAFSGLPFWVCCGRLGSDSYNHRFFLIGALIPVQRQSHRLGCGPINC